MPATYEHRNGILVHADGPDHAGFCVFEMVFPKEDGQEKGESQFYKRDHSGWFFLSDGTWYPTSSVPMQVRESRVKYGHGEIRSRRG